MRRPAKSVDSDKCVECLNCIPNCPYDAVTSVF
ncbi:MAG: 4Fe-4S binding protein [Spirochaetota bacterium]